MASQKTRCAHLRDNRKHQHDAEPALIEQVRDNGPNPEQQHSSQETTRIVRELFSGLIERDRQILIRVYFYQQDKALVCRELDIEMEHLRRVLYRAKQRLRALVLAAQRKQNLDLVTDE